MDKSTFIITILSLSILLVPRTQAQLKAQSDTQKASTPTITVTGLEVTDKTLMLRYEIKNGYGHDIWVCEDIDVDYESDFEIRMAEDSQTLLIRRRLDVPMNRFRNHPTGRYVRLRTGESRMESLLLPFPIRPRCVFFRIRQRKS